jgi:23S rRNA pseudouridine2605 synthase
LSIRLNKLLASRGIGARRKCDALIQSGAVRVNGAVVTEPGRAIEPQRDKVEVDGRPLPGPAPFRYYVLHKPVGVISTLSDPEGRRSLRDLMPPGPRLFSVGRLDADTSGLLLLTNDGELAHHLMHPRYGVVKRYRAHVDRAPSEHQLARLQNGVEFEPGVVSSPAQVWLRDSDSDEAVIELALHEGRHRQVRKMCEAVGLEVRRLHRYGYGPLKLGELSRGMWRELSEEEVEALRAASARPQRRGASAAGFTGRRSFDRPRPGERPRRPEPSRSGGREGSFERRGERPRRESTSPMRRARSFEDRERRPRRFEGEDRPRRFERSDRPQRSPREDRPRRFERSDRPQRPSREDRPRRFERSDRTPRFQREDRPRRFERSDRPQRSPREDRPRRFERSDRPQRFQREDRPRRFERSDPPRRFERGDRPQRSTRTDRPRRFERTDRPYGSRPPARREGSFRPRRSEAPRGRDFEAPRRSGDDRRRSRPPLGSSSRPSRFADRDERFGAKPPRSGRGGAPRRGSDRPRRGSARGPGGEPPFAAFRKRRPKP